MDYNVLLWRRNYIIAMINVLYTHVYLKVTKLINKVCILYFICVFVTQLIFTINVCDPRIYKTSKVQWNFVQEIYCKCTGARICGPEDISRKSMTSECTCKLKQTYLIFSELNTSSGFVGRTNIRNRGLLQR